MASLAANDANAIVLDAALASPPRVALGDVEHARPTAARPAGSATRVRIAGLAVLCAATLVAPALLLVWMPIVLGVPHIASDLRYLVLPLPRRQVVLSLVACGLLVALKAATLVGAAAGVLPSRAGMSFLRMEMVVVALWLLGMLALEQPTRRSHAVARHLAQHGADVAKRDRAGGMTRHRCERRYAAWLVSAAAACAIIALPVQFAIAAAFMHNVVAIVAWLAIKRPARAHAIAVVAAIAGALAILVVAGPAVAAWSGGATSPWLTVDKAAHVMFGGLPLPTARALMIGFAFLQAVHYVIWLDWIPSGTPRTPTTSWLAVTAGTLVVITAALVDAAWARTTYLALATFHIYLELVVLGARLARRSGRVPRSAAATQLARTAP